MLTDKNAVHCQTDSEWIWTTIHREWRIFLVFASSMLSIELKHRPSRVQRCNVNHLAGAAGDPKFSDPNWLEKVKTIHSDYCLFPWPPSSTYMSLRSRCGQYRFEKIPAGILKGRGESAYERRSRSPYSIFVHRHHSELQQRDRILMLSTSFCSIHFQVCNAR